MPEIILSRNFTLSLKMVRPWLQLRHTKNEEWRRLISDLVTGPSRSRGHGRREGPDGDKWSQTTQETLGGSGVSEANGVLRNHYHPPRY